MVWRRLRVRVFLVCSFSGGVMNFMGFMSSLSENEIGILVYGGLLVAIVIALKLLMSVLK